MDKRIEVRCSEGELEAWKLAAGRVPLSRWLRDVANGAAEPMGFIPDSGGIVVARVSPHRESPLPRPYAASEKHPYVPAVRPDFKGGKR
jgi:hypothetical protein